MDHVALFIMLIIGGTGALIFYLGWSRKRYGVGSYCSHCFYRVDTSGAQVERCSECGSDITRTAGIVPWQPARRRSFLAIGMVLIALSTAGIVTNIWGSVRRIDVLRLLPTWYLLRADVSVEGNFGSEEIQILRERVLDAAVSVEQERTFTRILSQRATNLHLDRRNQTMSYTGMTLNLLLLHKPSEDDVDALVNAIVEQVFRANNLLVVRNADGKPAEFILPTLDFDPVWPFLRTGEITSVRMRTVIILNAIEQDGVSLLRPGFDLSNSVKHAQLARLSQPMPGDIASDNSDAREYRILIDAQRFNPDQPIELDFMVRWFIEDQSMAVDDAEHTTGIEPWHVSTHHIAASVIPVFDDSFEMIENREPDWITPSVPRFESDAGR